MTEQLHYINGVLMGAAMMTLLLGAMILRTGEWNRTERRNDRAHDIHNFFSLTLFVFALNYIPGILYYSGICESYVCNCLYENLAYVDIAFIPLLALKLMHKKIKIYHWVIFMLPAFVLVILSCILDESMFTTMTGIELCTLIYSIGTYLYMLRKLRKWDRQLFDNYSDVSYKLTIWYQKLTIPLYILPLMWIPMYVFIDYLELVYTFYYLLSIVVFICFINYAQKQDEVCMETTEPQQAEASTPLPIETSANNDAKNTDIPSWAEKLEKMMIHEKIYLQPDLDCNTLALAIGTNRTYLSRYLNQEKGMTFYDYINGYRIDDSLNLLKLTDLSIDAIAEKCGFRDRITFYRIFKNKIGRSPSEWKKLVREPIP